MAGGLAILKTLRREPQVYDNLERKTAKLAAGVAAAAKQAGEPITINRVGSMITFFFNPAPVKDWEGASSSDTERFASFFRGMLERGVYWPCSQYEAAFVSAALTDADIDRTIEAADASFADLQA